MSRLTKAQNDKLRSRLDQARGFDPSIRQVLALPKPGYQLVVKTDISDKSEFMALDPFIDALKSRYGFTPAQALDIEILLRGMRPVAIDFERRVHLMVDMYAVADPDQTIDRYLEKMGANGADEVYALSRLLDGANRFADGLIGRPSPLNRE